jgi:hypothetical protein
MINAPPRTAIAISPGEYFVFFLGGAACCWVVLFFFFLRGFFDMSPIFYPKAFAAGLYGSTG